ncbi:MAG: PKD domain-containing protein, partial [Flavobacteriales bacterium]|nr:PKD domain-containing protein [Flavobacteriales bacterium]
MKKLFTIIASVLSSGALLQAQTTHQVSVTSNVFTPADLTIEIGDIVEWNCTQGSHNVDGTQTVFPSNPESFGNSVAPATWTYSHTFNTSGFYNYQCDPHAGLGMTGTITVTCTDPLPDFSTSITDYTVDFTDATVSPTSTSTLWDFGDGNISTQAEPQHTYVATGNYTVCQTVTNSCSTDSTCHHVNIV